MIRLPTQVNPRPDRTASAPYNFIPLPETIVRPVMDAEQLPSHARYGTADTRYPHTGYFDVILTTRSPLYIRTGLTTDQFDRQERGEDETEFNARRDAFHAYLETSPNDAEAHRHFQHVLDALEKNAPEFFYTDDAGQPVIPGSSLRGMLRTVVEIVSYGKVERVTSKQLFYRSLDNSSLGLAYRGRMVGARRGVSLVEAGFLKRDGDGWTVTRCELRRVSHEASLESVDRRVRKVREYLPSTADRVPDWRIQHQRLWARPEQGKPVGELSAKERPGWEEGILVLSGWAPKKRAEFFFLPPGAQAEVLPVPPEVIRHFEDDDQITWWQERAFPMNKPQDGARKRDGLLETDPAESEPAGHGEPVFFLREHGAFTFLGRARMFRLPYRSSPRDFVAESLRRAEEIDYPEALFGYSKGRKIDQPQGDRARGYAGRIAVTDAVLHEPNGEESIWLQDAPLVPPILATPKPTAFQQYLVQRTDLKNSLAHYEDPPSTTAVRGAKRYWHQGRRTAESLTAPLTVADLKRGDPTKQYTQFKPVRERVRFRFRVYFENLSPAELGALCWALHPRGDTARTYYHSLGMGKSLGMGAVQLDATLHLTDRAQRYQKLFNGDWWETGEMGPGEPLSDRTILIARTDAFERHILRELHAHEERLAAVPRIAMLLGMMEWEGVPPNPAPDSDRRHNSRTMTVQEFKERPVLPDPLVVLGRVGLPPTAPVAGPILAGAEVREPTPTIGGQILQEAMERAQSRPTRVAKRGENVAATVLRVRDGEVTLRLHTAQAEELKAQVSVMKQPAIGATVRVKVQQVTGDRVTQIRYGGE